MDLIFSLIADAGGIVVIIVIALLLLLVLSRLRAGFFFIVRTQEMAIVERFGRFRKVAKPGLNFKVPIIDVVRDPVSLRIQQLEVNIESKTKDNVFVTVPVAVQYVIQENQVVDAFYRLSDPEAQIRSYVFDTVRSALSGLELDAAFESKDDIARTVEETLSHRMHEFGFNIVNTLVTDISPDQRVRDSMNSINAAQRDRVAAQSLAEADKIKRVTQAQAEAESRRLQGEGVAAQRKAIAVGIAEQYEMLRQVGIEDTAEQLLLMNQYFDTLPEVSRNGRSNVLLMPSNPGAIGGFADEIRNAMMQAQGAEAVVRDGTQVPQQPRPSRASQPAPTPSPQSDDAAQAQPTSTAKHLQSEVLGVASELAEKLRKNGDAR